jgi:hypothetical protein
MRVRSTDIHAFDWKRVRVPGVACGATRPFLLRAPGSWGDAFVISARFPWWPAVVVGSGWNDVGYGDIDGDGRDEAVLDLDCSNAGGTAAGQLAFASVVYALRGHTLSSVGVVAPRQPLTLGAHAPIVSSRIRSRSVVAVERWYGPYDGDCCGSGIARTLWKLVGGKLAPVETKIIRPVWTSSVQISAVVAEPVERELDADRRTTVVVQQPFRLDLTLNNFGGVKRDAKITLTIHGQSSSPVERTLTIDRLPFERTVSFTKLGHLPKGKAIAILAIHEPGAYPVRYPLKLIH